MATALAQGTRIGSFSSSLGEDVLAITAFDGTESLSGLFEFRVEVVSDDKAIDFDRILGTGCGFYLHSNHDGVKRHFRGVLTEAQWTGRNYDLRSYRLVLRPWLWLLTRTTNCRIFANKNVPDIVRAVFQDKGFDQFEMRLSGSYPVLEYCVQYRESDFAFVSRLMEEYGIYYYFDHDESGHKLIMADSSSAHQPKLAGAKLALAFGDLDFTHREDLLSSWTDERKHRSGKVMLNDYNYEKPAADLKADRNSDAKYQHGKLELYDYPGRYDEKGKGVSLAKVRLEAEQAMDRRSFAEGDAVTACPGFVIEPAGQAKEQAGKQFLAVRADHVFRSTAYLSTRTGPVSEDYSGKYEFQPLDIPYRPRAETPKPIIYGPQTALVSSEVDDECRIEVQFYWDRDKKNSRYVRIAQPWAGNGWGDVKIPRVGMEVVVEYLNGDPDHPLVTGSVYNAQNVAPYVKDKHNAVSGTRTETLGGSGYNELIMDDTSGDELIRFHAQHDLEGKVENDERRNIGRNVDVDIGMNRTESIGLTWSVSAREKIEFKVGPNTTLTMDPAGITLKATMISLQADALLNLSSQGISQLTASAPVIINGALVLIN